MYPMSSIQEVKDFCKSIKVNPAKIFIASNGAVVATFNSSKHQTRFGKEMQKHWTKLGFKVQKQPDDLVEWEVTAYNEMFATRH
jgi:predicted mannosyl-3-phosphoglycerate phosphatase (HAD superfamily)